MDTKSERGWICYGRQASEIGLESRCELKRRSQNCTANGLMFDMRFLIISLRQIEIMRFKKTG